MLIDRRSASINVGGTLHSVRPVSRSAPKFPSPIERRSGVERRGLQPTELVNEFRPEDRRLGLGRRWEDWCRPIGQHPGRDRELENRS